MQTKKVGTETKKRLQRNQGYGQQTFAPEVRSESSHSKLCGNCAGL